ncbi:glycosyl transferase [Massilia eurypsychrophila]|uniref:Glycosyl transferase n=1 Tax=Massilia eurypsychrophila TaxID=1485217 RepID=A0A2G8TGK0_9BURK|nr:glycosyltransferase family 9 protein [Massilia eurypsychrophila]PIL45166.1 glycosyl transferase [Massilia eurypsychrophila]
MSAPGWDGARNILCVRLDALGDVLMCTPAMRTLRHACPGRRLTLLTSHSGAAAAPFIDELDAVIAYQAPWMKSSAVHAPSTDAACAEALAAERFDGAVIFTSYSQSALPAAMLCYLAGIPLRLAHCRENPYQLLTDWVADPEPDATVRHEVRRQLDLVGAIGCRGGDGPLSFRVRERDIDAMRGRLDAAGIDVRSRWILLHPGASAPSRRYPADKWSAAIRALAARGAGALVLSGSGEELALIEQIRAGCGVPVQSLAGQVDLGELGAAISLASVMVSNNTGPAHMAAALGTPLVDLYALTNPQHTPWHVEHRLLFHDVACRFCYKSVCPQGHHDCLARVDPDDVADAVCSLLDSPAQQLRKAPGRF